MSSAANRRCFVNSIPPEPDTNSDKLRKSIWIASPPPDLWLLCQSFRCEKQTLPCPGKAAIFTPMSRSVLLVLALLLSLAVPPAGMAGDGAAVQPCPDHKMDMTDIASPAGSCCDEGKSAELGYPVCKAGQNDCQGPVVLAIPAVKTIVIPSIAAIFAAYDPDSPLSSAESFWRPPRI